MRRKIYSLVAAVCVAAAIVGFFVFKTPQKVAATSCTNSTISGTYGGYFWGSQNGTLSNSVTVITFSGSSFSLSYWGMIGGSSTSGSVSGNYTVNSNCEGTMYNPSNGSTYNTFSVVSSGSEVDFVNNASGANISGVARKQ